MKTVISWLFAIIGLIFIAYRGYQRDDFSDFFFILFIIIFVGILNKVTDRNKK